MAELNPAIDYAETLGERTGPFAHILDAQAKKRVNGVCERCIRPTCNQTFLDLRYDGWFLTGGISCPICSLLMRRL